MTDSTTLASGGRGINHLGDCRATGCPTPPPGDSPLWPSALGQSAAVSACPVLQEETRGTADKLRAAPRTAHRPLLPRVWELRDAITVYDAAYVALAEQFDVPLLTCDAKLGGSNGHRAEIVVYPRS